MHALTIVRLSVAPDIGSFLQEGKLTFDTENAALNLFHGMKHSFQARHPSI